MGSGKGGVYKWGVWDTGGWVGVLWEEWGVVRGWVISGES